MTASVPKQDPNIKRFKRTLIYFNTNTQYANFRGNPLYQATKGHLTTDKRLKTMKNKKAYLVLVEFLQIGAWKTAHICQQSCPLKLPKASFCLVSFFNPCYHYCLLLFIQKTVKHLFLAICISCIRAFHAYHVSTVSTPFQWRFKKRAMKNERSKSARE